MIRLEANMSDGIDKLKALHTSLIDSRNGYEEALEDAEGKGLTALSRNDLTAQQGRIGNCARFVLRRRERR
jgi:hypothetical protein